MSSANSLITTSTASNEKIASTRRRVHFSHTTKAHFIPGVWEMSEEDIESTWLTGEDLFQIQRTTLKTVKRMRQGKKINEEKYCTRGLEYMGCADLRQQRETNKASVRIAVLTEQHRQKLSGLNDPEEIRRRSLLSTENARLKALRLAASDATVGRSVVDICPAKICNSKITRDQYNSCGANQSIEKDYCASILRNDNSQADVEFTQTNQENLWGEGLSSPTKRIMGSWKSGANNNISTEKEQGPSSELTASSSIFNKVFFKISRGLKGEAPQTKLTKTNEVRSGKTPDGCTAKELDKVNGYDMSKPYKNRVSPSFPMENGESITQKTLVSKCA